MIKSHYVCNWFPVTNYVLANITEPHIVTDTPVSADAAQGVSPTCAP